MEYNELKSHMRLRVQESLGYAQDFTDRDVEEQIDEILLQDQQVRLLSPAKRRLLKKELFDSLRRLDILQCFIEDPSVTEIMINGKDDIFIEQAGRLHRLEKGFDSQEKLMDVIQLIVAGCNRVVNESSPIVDARLADGSRVNVVLNPIALNGPIVTIRRFPAHPITMDQLIAMGSITQEAAAFLRTLMEAGYNMIISGGTGSGKTTFLNVLSSFIPSDERIITIEDSAELQLQGLRNLVRMETRNKNVEGCKEVTIRDLIKTSLRMRPDRIIVGEVRGAEAVDLLAACNTGHSSASSLHANSAADMLSRLENMVLMGVEIPLPAIRAQIASGIDIVVHLSRMRDKSRRVVEIAEIDGYVNGEIILRPLFVFEEDADADRKKDQVNGRLCKKGDLRHEEKLQAAGLQIL